MKTTAGLSLLSAAALVFLAGVFEAPAQARRALTRPAGTGAAVQPALGGEGAVIRKMEATGQNARVKTPDFRNDAPSSEPPARARDWARISVDYETGAEWTDELVFQYKVLVKNPKTGAFTMFPGAVTYIDIPMGKYHKSTMFLRPTTLARYGNVEWAGVEIYLNGRRVDMTQSPKDDLRPWTAAITTREGVLLNRAQTPFANVAIDNYETIKPK